MVKKLTLILLVVTSLTITSLAIPPPRAKAGDGGLTACEALSGLLTGGIVTQCPIESFSGLPNPPASLTYSLQNVTVTATSDVHNYAFDLVPSDGTAASHYTGTYTVSSRVAHEDYGQAGWDFTCPYDPWTFPTTLVCTQPASLVGSSLAEPAGAQALEGVDGGPATLASALQHATAGTVNPASKTLGQSETLRASAAQSTATKPDFEAVQIAGPTTIRDGDNVAYSATIRNDGSVANGSVEVTIGFAGGLQALDNLVQSISLNCSQGPSGTNFTCQGGTLTAGQQVTLQFRVHATASGQAAITVATNPRRTVDESDFSNNNLTYIVTVTK